MNAYIALFQHELVHILLSILSAVLIIIVFLDGAKNKKSLYWWSFIGGFLGEFFIDVDHLFDYFAAYGATFRLDYFLKSYMFDKLHKSFVLFHAWEWVIIALIAAYFAKRRALRYLLAAIALGMFLHLIYDTYYNHFLILGYSIIYRVIHGFDLRYLSI